MDIKFLTQENEIQKLYSKFGLVVPVGDLETGKAPAIQPLPAQATQTSVTFNFNVMSGAVITAIEYKVNDGEAVSVTPQKGVVTVELSDLEYNSGPYEIELTVTNETGDTSVTQTADLVPYTDWATADEVLDGNKFIGEDGQEAVGTYVPEETVLGALNVTVNGIYNPAGTEYDGYNEVTVNVQPNLTTLNVTENGTYTPTDFDGYSEVTVAVSGGASVASAFVEIEEDLYDDPSLAGTTVYYIDSNEVTEQEYLSSKNGCDVVITNWDSEVSTIINTALQAGFDGISSVTMGNIVHYLAEEE